MINVPACPVGVFLAKQPNGPTRVVVGAHDISIETIENVLNRFRSEKFSVASRVSMGMIELEAEHFKDGNMLSVNAVEMKIDCPPGPRDDSPGLVEENYVPRFGHSAAWLLRFDDGRKALLVWPSAADMATIAEALSNCGIGQSITIQRVDAGDFSAKPHIVM